MPDAIITSTASTFGTISGTFSADQSTITGTVSGVITGTLSGSVGVPGPQGPTGPQGPIGPEGPPGEGGTWGSIVGTLSDQTDLQTALNGKYSTSNPAGYITSSALTGYATESFVTSQGYITSSALTPYLTKADNLASVASVSTARDNLGLGSLSTPTFAGVTVQGSGANVANLTPTSLSLTHATSGSFTIQPSVGITFPNGSVQTTAFTGSTPDYITSVSSPLSVTSGNLTINLSAYSTKAVADTLYAPIAAGMPTSGTVGQVLTKQSGTSYDAAWATLIPGDRYLTTSTTSNTVSNGTKTFTVGTGLSYSSQQDVVISYNASNHMHALVTSYNSGTGVLVVDVQHHTGSGTYASWTVNVGGTTPLQSVEWGEILGVIGDQADLAGILNDKLEITDAASTYQTLSGMSSYLTTSAAASTYLTQANAASTYYLQTNPAGYITSSALSPYLTSATAASTYQTLSGMSSYLTTATAASTYATILEPSVDGILTVEPSGSNSATVQVNHDANNYIHLRAGVGQISMVYGGSTKWFFNDTYLQFPGGTQQTVAYPGPSGFLLKADNLSGLANTGTARTNLGLGTMATETASNYLTTATASTIYAPLASPALTGNVTITSNSTGPALVITQDGTGDVIQFKDVTSDTTYSFIDQNGKVNTVASTTTSAGFNVPHGTAPTSPVNGDIWTTTGNLWVRINGVSHPVSLQSNSAQLSSNNTFTNASSTYGNSTAAGTIGLATGATISGSTKTVNIGTGGVAGSTTNVTIGSTTGTSTTTLQGTTNGVTQTAGDSSLKLATTAFVTTADNLKANIASPTFTGVPAAPTASPGTNTTQIATTAFVQAAISGGSGAVWGSITGTLSSQTDLQSALNAKLDSTTAATTYYPLTGNPSGFLTSAPVTSVAGKTGVVTLDNTDISGLGTMATATAADYSTTTVANGLYYPLSGNPSGFLTSASLTGYATETFVTSQGYITSSALTPYAPLAGATFTGKVVTVASAAGGAGLNLPHGAAPTTPVNGDIWTTTGNVQWRRNGGTQSLPNIGTANTFSAGAKQTVSHSATTAGLNVGPVAGDPSTPANGDVWYNSTTNGFNARVNGANHQLNTVKAWVNFNGTGTPAIRASLNVSSITDNGVGDYTVNFTTAFADANYAMSGFGGDALFSVGVTLSSWGVYTQTTSAFRFKVYYGTNTVVDTTNIFATFLR